MARGHRLNTSLVLAAVHGLSGLFRAVSAVEPSLSRPPPLISSLASVDVKQHGEGSKLFCDLIGVQMQLNGEDMQRRGDAGKLNVD